jgi:hypothetical protein
MKYRPTNDCTGLHCQPSVTVSSVAVRNITDMSVCCLATVLEIVFVALEDRRMMLQLRFSVHDFAISFLLADPLQSLPLRTSVIPDGQVLMHVSRHVMALNKNTSQF